MATLKQKIAAEQKVRELLEHYEVEAPDAIEYGNGCIRLFWNGPKVCLVVDIDPPPGDVDGPAAIPSDRYIADLIGVDEDFDSNRGGGRRVSVPPHAHADAYPPHAHADAYPPHAHADAYPPHAHADAYPPHAHADAYPPHSHADAYGSVAGGAAVARHGQGREHGHDRERPDERFPDVLWAGAPIQRWRMASTTIVKGFTFAKSWSTGGIDGDRDERGRNERQREDDDESDGVRCLGRATIRPRKAKTHENA